MSTDEQDVIAGRLVRQQTDSTRRLTLINAELDRISKDFKSLSISLTMRDYVDGLTNRTAEEVLAKIDVGKILEHISEAKSAMKSRDEASERLKQLGLQ